MKIFLKYFILFCLSCTQTVIQAANEIVVSSYYNGQNPRDEWVELLVLKDNLDLRGYNIRDNNSNQNSWQNYLTFKSIPLWQNLREGTIIMIHFRPCSFTGIIKTYPIDTAKKDGYIEVPATNTTFFSVSGSASSAANFGNSGCTNSSSDYNGALLNFSASKDILEIVDASGNHVHGLAHSSPTSFGADYVGMPGPKVSAHNTISSNGVVFVYPGNSIASYDSTSGGTAYRTNSPTTTDSSFGLPNYYSGTDTANARFWRKLREPEWDLSPSLKIKMDTINFNSEVLNWNKCSDTVSTDKTQGYIILRSTSPITTVPLDGKTYSTGDTVGNSITKVITNIPKSSTLTYTDNYSISCNQIIYYAIFAFRFQADDLKGNNYNLSRGRAYNTAKIGTTNYNRKKNTNLLTLYHY